MILPKLDYLLGGIFLCKIKVGGDMENVRLTNNQKIFCNEYLVDLNATKAYKAAKEL